MNEVKNWKKVYENDLGYIINEFKDNIKTPAVITLSGEVGSGKTTFLKSFNPDIDVSSPTYSIINNSGDFAHADFYRIEEKSEIEHLEIDQYIEDKNFFFVEWGRDYTNELKRLIGDQFHYYDLEISVNKNPNSENEKQSTIESRNYFLNKISE